jgi:hydrophobe/amphiphile efflux-3 (HAE3) family protein
VNPLEKIAIYCESHPYHIIGIVLLATLIIGSGAASIQMNANMESFLPEDDDAITATLLLSEVFGGDSYEIALIKGDITSYEGLSALIAFEQQVLTDPELADFIDSSTSFYDMLVAGGYVPVNIAPGTPAIVQQVLAADAASDDPRIVGSFISEDLSATRVVFGVPDEIDNVVAKEKVERLRQIALDVTEQDNTLSVGITGVYSQTVDSLDSMQKDNQILFPLAGIYVIIVMLIIFRKITDTLFPFVTIGFALIWIMGIMGHLSIPFTAMFVALAPLLLGIAVDYAIHIVFRYREERAKGMDVAHSINKCIRNTGTTVFLSAITTVFGFSSFFISDLPPMRQFGLLAVLGIVFSFILVVTLLPAMTVIRDRKKATEPKRTGQSVNRGLSLVLNRLVKGAIHHKAPILIATMLVTAGSLALAPQVDTALNWDDMVSKDLESTKVSVEMETYFASSIKDMIYILVDGDPLSPDVMATVLGMEQQIRSVQDTNDEGRKLIGSSQAVASYVDLILAANGGALPATKEQAQMIVSMLAQDPQSAQAIAQLVALDPESEHYLSLGLVSATIDITSEHDMETIVDIVSGIAEQGGDGTSYRPAGSPTIISSIMGGMLSSQIRTTILALILCCLVVVVITRSGVNGILAITPVALTIAWEFLLLYVIGWSFDLFTVMISALIVGLGIDFAVHIIQRFREEVEAGRGTEEAIEVVILNVGKALISATVTTSGAFFIIGMSVMPILARFGMLTAIVLVFSFVAAIVVLPPILAWDNDRRVRKVSA